MLYYTTFYLRRRSFVCFLQNELYLYRHIIYVLGTEKVTREMGCTFTDIQCVLDSEKVKEMGCGLYRHQICVWAVKRLGNGLGLYRHLAYVLDSAEVKEMGQDFIDIWPMFWTVKRIRYRLGLYRHLAYDSEEVKEIGSTVSVEPVRYTSPQPLACLDFKAII